MKIKFCLIVLLILLLSCSCMTTGVVRISDGSSYRLQSLDLFEENLDTYRLLSGSFPLVGETAVEAYLTVNDEKLEMYMFAPTGQTLAFIGFDGKKSYIESEFLPENSMVSDMIVAELQLCYGRADLLEKELKASGLEFSEAITPDGFVRNISKNGEMIYHIVSENLTVTVENIQRGYSYVSESLDWI